MDAVELDLIPMQLLRMQGVVIPMLMRGKSHGSQKQENLCSFVASPIRSLPAVECY